MICTPFFLPKKSIVSTSKVIDGERQHVVLLLDGKHLLLYRDVLGHKREQLGRERIVREISYRLEGELLGEGVDQFVAVNDPHLFQDLAEALAAPLLPIKGPLKGLYRDDPRIHEKIAQLLLVRHVCSPLRLW